MRWNRLWLVGMLLIALTFTNCRRGGQAGPNLKVVKIIDGNTIQTQTGQTIHLLGIEDNEDCFAYLENYVLDQSITYKRDSRQKRSSKRLDLYVSTSSGESINGVLLRNQLSPFYQDGVHDSLQVFKQYASGEVIADNANTGKSSGKHISDQPRYHRRTSTKKRAFKAVVKETEEGVFLVQTKNQYGRNLSIGTGFFINDQGDAVSNYHVFEGGSKWYVKLLSGETFRVQEIYAGSEKDDYVIFNVDLAGKKINPIPLYEGEVEKAEEIFVVGNPEGLESSLSTGVVAALREDFWDMDLIQITAPISSGSSGSPVMTMQGEAIGIATLKKIGCENCNFAINIDLIKAALKQL